MHLTPHTVASILRAIKLTEFCSNLSDDKLWQLGEACGRRDEAAIPVLSSDRLLFLAVLACTKTEEGWAEILEAVDLEMHHRAYPDGGDVWTH